MKKFSIAILLCLILLNSCSPVVTLSPIPASTITPLPAFTPSPIPTVTPTALPFLNVGRSQLITVNSMAAVHSSEYLTDIWTVGDDGFIAHKSPLGYVRRMDSPEPVHLYDITFVSLDDGWIVGEGSLILHWNGKDWDVSSPAIVHSGWPFSSYDLYSVAFTGANDGWAAGCTGSEGGQYFLVYHWDGTVWSEVTLSDERNLWACVHDIVALSSTDVWMVGTGWDAGKEYGISVHWDGEDWEVVADIEIYNIYSISALSSDNIWAITQQGIVLHWDGIEWNEKARLDSARIIYARASDEVIAVGDKIWYWNGINWKDISLYTDLPVDTNIKSIVEGSRDEGGHPIIYLLDSSGILYWFTYAKFK